MGNQQVIGSYREGSEWLFLVFRSSMDFCLCIEQLLPLNRDIKNFHLRTNDLLDSPRIDLQEVK